MEVPLRTSHIRHLKASALFLKVQTLQSQYPSSEEGFGCRFGLRGDTHRSHTHTSHIYMYTQVLYTQHTTRPLPVRPPAGRPPPRDNPPAVSSGTAHLVGLFLSPML